VVPALLLNLWHSLVTSHLLNQEIKRHALLALIIHSQVNLSAGFAIEASSVTQVLCQNLIGVLWVLIALLAQAVLNCVLPDPTMITN
jgi:hypothetical protein